MFLVAVRGLLFFVIEPYFLVATWATSRGCRRMQMSLIAVRDLLFFFVIEIYLNDAAGAAGLVQPEGLMQMSLIAVICDRLDDFIWILHQLLAAWATGGITTLNTVRCRLILLRKCEQPRDLGEGS